MSNKEIGLGKVKELVERFNKQLPAYKKADYNETQTRRDFIDPFFKALGWDIDNTQGLNESYREVIHEDKVKVGKATKAPDYSFKLSGGQRLFFVEAKKPSVAVKDDIQPAYQVRRYGWSAKLNISVVTDFEEFAIYDCNKKPNPTDKASVARVKYLTFIDYATEWDFIWNTFSKEAVLMGSFDKFISTNANKKGTATVDKEFLVSLDSWRTLLAETISKENKQLDEDELNFTVQQTLDRIIFLRICEDRNIEPYGSLLNGVKNGDYYKNLLREFKQADDKFNSGLFDFKKDKLSNQLLINNKTLKTIIKQLYYPECPYEFSVLSVEILGSAYEQFLGKTITIDAKGKAVIEIKPAVRKAGGVFYTPQYIVNYIVENTIGNLTKNKTPKQVEEIKIVDPACGSGSFLLGAYQYLLNWHKNYYIKNKDKKITLTPDGNLTTTEKKRILLNNIYGVDIDTNAVEVTKLSLLLKCMEGETQASIANQMTMFNERVLPTLDDNIKSGNSLIDLDYYDSQFDFGEERKVKPFSWQKSFPSIFTNGGFDVVIGNPPYVDSEEMTKTNVILRNYAVNKFYTAKGNWDMYCIYTEKAITLLRENGKFGFIIPNKFLSAPYGIHLKQFISQYHVCNIEDYSSVSVFVSDRKINVYPVVLIIKKNLKNEIGVYNKHIEINNEVISQFKINFTIKKNEVEWTSKFSNSAELINKVFKLSKRIKELFIVENSATVSEAYLLKEILIDDSNMDDTYKFINTGTIDRYSNTWGFGKTQYLKDAYLFPILKKDEVKKIIPNRIRTINENRIVVAGMVKNLEATIIDKTFISGKSTTLIYNKNNAILNLNYLLGLLNSKLYNFIFIEINKHNAMAGGYVNVSKSQLENFIYFEVNNKIDFEYETEITYFVIQILQLNITLQATNLENKKQQIKSKIAYYEDKINALVYKLYNLSLAEINTIENS